MTAVVSKQQGQSRPRVRSPFKTVIICRGFPVIVFIAQFAVVFFALCCGKSRYSSLARLLISARRAFKT